MTGKGTIKEGKLRKQIIIGVRNVQKKDTGDKR